MSQTIDLYKSLRYVQDNFVTSINDNHVSVGEYLLNITFLTDESIFVQQFMLDLRKAFDCITFPVIF